MKFKIRLLFVCCLVVFAMGEGRANSTKIDEVAERMLLSQRKYGGWPKTIQGAKTDYEIPFTNQQLAYLKQSTEADDATIDNNATTKEIDYLAKAYAATKNKKYIEAVQRGIDYLLLAQYENGGWPQFYPNKKLYRAQITYNDNAVYNVLLILRNVVNADSGYSYLGEPYRENARKAIQKGIDCILKTQVRINGELTIWAAQYDHITLLPAKARSFELPSLASSESSNILVFLMQQKNPSEGLKEAIEAAVRWFDANKIVGWKAAMVSAPNLPKGKDRILVKDSASVIWARFYDLETMKPQFVGRDSQPKERLSDIEHERRIGYSWYGNWGEKVAKAYKKWEKVNAVK